MQGLDTPCFEVVPSWYVELDDLGLERLNGRVERALEGLTFGASKVLHPVLLFHQDRLDLDKAEIRATLAAAELGKHDLKEISLATFELIDVTNEDDHLLVVVLYRFEELSKLGVRRLD